MDAALRRPLRSLQCNYLRVSILVLMDAALRQMCLLQVNPNPLRFNPCFDGCRPATLQIATDILFFLSFNPCFDGCRPATVSALSSSFSFEKFQSLF